MTGATQPPGSGDRGSAAVAMALVLAVLLLASAITVGIQPSESGSAGSSPSEDVQVVKSGVSDAMSQQRSESGSSSVDCDGRPDGPVEARACAAAQSNGKGPTDRPENAAATSAIENHPMFSEIENGDEVKRDLVATLESVAAQQSATDRMTSVSPAENSLQRGTLIDFGNASETDYKLEWDFTDPGEAWSKTGETREIVINRRVQWARERPGAGWDKTGDTKRTVVSRDTQWAYDDPGSEWTRTGKRREIQVDRHTKWSSYDPGSEWDKTGDIRRVIGYDYQWSSYDPGPEWSHTGKTQRRVIDRDYKWSRTKPPGSWERMSQSRQVVTGYRTTTDHDHPGPGWQRVGVVDRERKKIDVDHHYEWSTSASRPSGPSGYDYDGIVSKRQTYSHTKTTWSSSNPGSGWSYAGDYRRVKDGYRYTTATSSPGPGWQYAGYSHTETDTDTKCVAYLHEDSDYVAVGKCGWGNIKILAKKTERTYYYDYRKPQYTTEYKYQKPVYEAEYRHKFTDEEYRTVAIYKWRKPQYRTEYRWVSKTYATQKQYRKRTSRIEYYWEKIDTRTQYEWTNTEEVTTYEWENTDTDTKYEWGTPVAGNEFTSGGSGDWTVVENTDGVRDAGLSIVTATLPDDRSNAFTVRAEQGGATFATGAASWQLEAWQHNGEALVTTSTTSDVYRVEDDVVVVNFDERTINGQDADVAFAPEVGTFDVEIRNGDGVYGTFTMLAAGQNRASDELSENADAEQVVYSVGFDVTYQATRTTYTDRITVEPTYDEFEPVDVEPGREVRCELIVNEKDGWESIGTCGWKDLKILVVKTDGS